MTDDEKFDAYVASRKPVHVTAIREKLVAGDAATVAEINEILGVLLYEDAPWVELVVKTARGLNPFAALLGKAVEAAAELRAIKDAERAEKDFADSVDDAAICSYETDRLHSGVREFSRYADAMLAERAK